MEIYFLGEKVFDGDLLPWMSCFREGKIGGGVFSVERQSVSIFF